MLVYFYDAQGMYSGYREAQRDKLQPTKWLKPPRSTFKAPPAANSYTADQYPCFNINSGEWELVASPAKQAEDQEKLQMVNEYGVHLFSADENGLPVEKSQEDLDAENAVKIAENDKNAAHTLMTDSIAQKAADITKGKSLMAIQAFITSFQIKAAYPEEYVNDGLKVYYAVGTYAVDDLLDTTEKIGEYYKLLLIEADKARDTFIKSYILSIS